MANNGLDHLYLILVRCGVIDAAASSEFSRGDVAVGGALLRLFPNGPSNPNIYEFHLKLWKQHFFSGAIAEAEDHVCH